MSQNEDESVIMNILNEYVQIHDEGFGAFNDLINASKTVDDVKSILTTFVRAYFVETSILFRLAAASMPAIISLRKTIQKLPAREEFNQIKSEAESQYDKVEKGLKIVRDALEDRTTRDKMVRIFTDNSAYHDGRIPRIEVCDAI
jgi:hypothetical protein